MRFSTFHNVVVDQTEKYNIYEYHANSDKGPVRLFKVLDQSRGQHFKILYNIELDEIGITPMIEDIPEYHMSIILDLIQTNAVQVSMKAQLSDERDVLILGPAQFADYLNQAYQNDDTEGMLIMLKSTILTPEALELCIRELRGKGYSLVADLVESSVKFT